MGEFTPGPWDFDEGDLSIYALDERGGTVSLFQVHEDCDAGVMEFAEATANARLAAAAPDLLEVAKLVLRVDDEWKALSMDERTRVEAAVAKAEPATSGLHTLNKRKDA